MLPVRIACTTHSTSSPSEIRPMGDVSIPSNPNKGASLGRAGLASAESPVNSGPKGIRMRAFDYVIMLFAFVYALATAHLLTTVAELIRERARVRFSWVHAAWMSVGLFEILAWWIGMWNMRARC